MPSTEELLLKHPTRSLTYHMLRCAESFSNNTTRTLGMLSLFAVPFGASGLWISFARETTVFSRSVTLAFLWLAISPFLITAGFGALARFIDDIKPRMSDAEHASYQAKCLDMLLSQKHAVASLPLGLVFGAVMFLYS
ncbi:MAG: hypothetical protein ACYS9X_21850, partial [Planctomycetota bacterium]